MRHHLVCRVLETPPLRPWIHCRPMFCRTVDPGESCYTWEQILSHQTPAESGGAGTLSSRALSSPWCREACWVLVTRGWKIYNRRTSIYHVAPVLPRITDAESVLSEYLPETESHISHMCHHQGPRSLPGIRYCLLIGWSVSCSVLWLVRWARLLTAPNRLKTLETGWCI